MDDTADELETVRAVCATIRQTGGAERVSVWTHNVEAGTASPLVAAGDDVPDRDRSLAWTRLPLEQVPVFAEVLRGPVVVEDAGSDPRLPPGFADDMGIRTVWLAPLMSRGRTIGFLAVEPAVAASHAAIAPLVPVVATVLAEALAWRAAEQRRAEGDLLVELTRASIDSVEATESICEALARRLGVRRVSLFLLEDGVPVARASRTIDGPVDHATYEAFRSRRAPMPPIVTAAVREWRPLVADDVTSPLIAGWGERFDVRSALVLPLGTLEEPFGVLTLDDPRPRRFTEPVVRLAEATAVHLSRLCRQAQLTEERARGLRSAAAVRRLLQEGARARSVEEAAEVVARVGREALDADHACAYLVDDDDGVISQILPVGVEPAWQAQLERWLLGTSSKSIALGARLEATRAPAVVTDATASDLLPAPLVAALALSAFVAVPLATPTRFLGCVVFSSSRGARRWSADDRHVVDQLMLEIALIIENAELRAADARRAEELAHLALHDPLTKLPNRVLLEDRLGDALRRTERSMKDVGVLFVDLTSFKAVNDRHGHAAGDAVLRIVAERMQRVVRPGDSVARLAGDEFIVVLPDVEAVEALAVAERLRAAVVEPMRFEGCAVEVAASVGISLGNAASTTAPQLLAHADTAMYRAKRTRGAGAVLFDAHLDGVVRA